MNDIKEGRFYPMTLRMVLEGDPREEIMHRLSVCEVPENEAIQIYDTAVRERIATIRSDCGGRLKGGIYAITVSAALFCIMWFGLHMIPRIVVGGCGVAVGFGTWRIIDGLAGILMAKSKEGPI